MTADGIFVGYCLGFIITVIVGLLALAWYERSVR